MNSGIQLPYQPTVNSSFVFASGRPILFPDAPDDHNVIQINIDSPGDTFELQTYDLAPVTGSILGAYVINGNINRLGVSVSGIPEPPSVSLLGVFVAVFLLLRVVEPPSANSLLPSCP